MWSRPTPTATDCARPALAALAGGATWLGTAQSHEALLLRKLGIGPDRCHILTWVYNGTEVPFDELIAADIDVSVGSLPGIDAVAAAARKLGKPARVHVKVDSGFGRNGFTPAGFDAALAKLVPLAKEGVLHIVGQWSHLAVADSPDVSEFVSSTDRQIETFKDFTRRMEQAGIPPEIRHLANTAATLDRPEIHFELTRPGIGLYGYEPDPAMGTPRDWHLTPAMRLQAQLGTVQGCGGRPRHLLRPHLPDPGQHLDRYCAAGLRRWHPPLRFRFRYGRCQARGEAGRPGAHHDH